MLGSWFTSTPSSGRSSTVSKANSTAAAPGGATVEDPPQTTEHDREYRASLESRSQPNPDQAQVQGQPLVTHHDEVLASILGTNAQQTTSTFSDAAERVPTRPVTPSAEPLYDPFSGALLGLLADVGPSQPQPSNDELWSHLSRILSLQSDIASMHLQMEGIGSRARAQARTRTLDPKPRRRQTKKPDEDKGEGQPVEGNDENVEDTNSEDSEIDADEETETKKVRDEEFARLGDQFTGRKDAIDGIMNKVFNFRLRFLCDFFISLLFIVGRTFKGCHSVPCPPTSHVRASIQF
jgi:hypothetical protein